jgi:hypothetical protein
MNDELSVVCQQLFQTSCLYDTVEVWGKNSESFSSVEFDFEVAVYKRFGVLMMKFLMVIRLHFILNVVLRITLLPNCIGT